MHVIAPKILKPSIINFNVKKLTIGSAVYDDFDGVYFTYQSLRLNTQEIWDDLDFIIIDNNPTSKEGKATKQFCEATRGGIRYIPFTERRSTSIRNEIFNNAEGRFCMSIDPHVLFESGTIQKLISFFGERPQTNDLYHGPMLYDVIDGHDPCGKMDPVWRDNMFGIWATDKRGNNKDNEPFEIEMHGLGIFACRTEGWQGFNEKFIGFGGEEGYIHKKFQQAGNKVWCLPFLRWLHRFQRPQGVKYPLITEERVWNYLVGHQELGLPFDDIVEHFKKTQPRLNVQKLIDGLGTTPAPEPIARKTITPTGRSRKRTQRPVADKVILWESSTIDFDKPTPLRYIDFRVIDSYDGKGSLNHIAISPLMPEEASITLASSQRPTGPARALLEDSASFWLSSGELPHNVIIDLGKSVPVEKVTIYPRKGLEAGLPTEFQVLGSNNLIDWQELSHQNILSQDI